MWYGFVARQKYLVTNDWAQVQALVNAYPYAAFRKFYRKDKAWEFVEYRYSRMSKSTETAIWNFGETFQKMSVNLNYFITHEGIYANVLLSEHTDFAVFSDEPNTSITRMGNVILIRNKQFKLNPDSLRDNAVALYYLINIIGGLADINIDVPDMSTFYLLRLRKSAIPEYKKLHDLIDSRFGKVGITVRHKQYKEVRL